MNEKVSPDTRFCPRCNADWQAGEIPQEHRKYYAETTTHFSRLIGLYSYVHDKAVAWECPDCGATFSR